jgi:hypothetical protein
LQRSVRRGAIDFVRGVGEEIGEVRSEAVAVLQRVERILAGAPADTEPRRARRISSPQVANELSSARRYLHLGTNTMPTSGDDDDLIHPDALRRIAEQKEMEELRELMKKRQKAEEEAHAFHQMFMEREIKPEAKRNVSELVRRAAEAGQREVLLGRFPSDWCTDKGRAINNFDPHWPETLTGLAKRGYEFYEKELKPAGYKMRAQILDFPGGIPGDVGLFLSW